MKIMKTIIEKIDKNQKNLRVQYNILKKMSRYLLTLTNVNERNIESACKNN